MMLAMISLLLCHIMFHYSFSLNLLLLTSQFYGKWRLDIRRVKDTLTQFEGGILLSAYF